MKVLDLLENPETYIYLQKKAVRLANISIPAN